MRDLRGLRILSTLTCVLTFPAQQLVRMPKTALTCFFSGDWGKMKMGRWYLGAEPTHINTSSLSSFIHSSLIQLFYDSVGSLHSGTPRTRRCVNGAHTGPLTFALHSPITRALPSHTSSLPRAPRTCSFLCRKCSSRTLRRVHASPSPLASVHKSPLWRGRL